MDILNSIIVWGTFTAIQFHTPKFDYYETHRKKLHVFKIPAAWYIPILFLTHGSAIASIVCYTQFNQDFFVVGYLLYVIIMFFDKLWFATFDLWRQKRLSIVVSFLLLGLSIALAIVMGWQVSTLLLIPFILLMGHLVVLSIDWYISLY